MSEKRGWIYLLNSRKYHYFVNSKSLCGRWMNFSKEFDGEDTGETEPRKDDCKACFKKLVELREPKGEDKK